MSRSNRETALNAPYNKFIRWNAKDGKFYMAIRGSKDKPTEITLPFNFVVLDMLSTVTGYNKATRKSLHANLVKQFDPQFFTVDLEGVSGFPVSGFWENIKDQMKGYGGRWTQIIFAMIKTPNSESGVEIARIELHGNATSKWFDLKDKVYSGAVMVSTATPPDADGYCYPVFKIVGVKEETEELAIKEDKVLQEYLAALFKMYDERAKAQYAKSQAKYAEPDESAAPVKGKEKPTGRTAATATDPDFTHEIDETPETEFTDIEPTDDLPF